MITEENFPPPSFIYNFASGKEKEKTFRGENSREKWLDFSFFDELNNTRE
jgi:hypothetical protein